MKKTRSNMEKRKYQLLITNEENWGFIKKKEIFGFNDERKKEINKLNIGDHIIIYIKGKEIGGLFSIINLDYKTKINFPCGDYKNKIKLNKIKVPKYSRKIYQDTINKVDMFKRKDKRWGVYLMGKGAIELNEKDYDTFVNLLN